MMHVSLPAHDIQFLDGSLLVHLMVENTCYLKTTIMFDNNSESMLSFWLMDVSHPHIKFYSNPSGVISNLTSGLTVVLAQLFFKIQFLWRFAP